MKIFVVKDSNTKLEKNMNRKEKLYVVELDSTHALIHLTCWIIIVITVKTGSVSLSNLA